MLFWAKVVFISSMNLDEMTQIKVVCNVKSINPNS